MVLNSKFHGSVILTFLAVRGVLIDFFITWVLIFYVRLVFFFPMIDGLIGFSLSYVGFSYDVDVIVVVFGLSQRLLCW